MVLGAYSQQHGQSLKRFATIIISFLLAVCSLTILSAKVSLPTPRTVNKIGNGVELRVLPIGDSITSGEKSSDGNGYRNTLHNSLLSRGNSIDFVGSIKSGTMLDNEHEGYPGAFIDGIREASSFGINAVPNIALLHAGTNDMYWDIDVANAPARLKNLIDMILESSPSAAVFVCQITPTANSTAQEQIDKFNAAIPDIVSSYVEAGKRLTLVNMNKALTTSDLSDGVHPNDNGYVKMAKAYYSAIESADSKGWITEPIALR